MSATVLQANNIRRMTHTYLWGFTAGLERYKFQKNILILSALFSCYVCRVNVFWLISPTNITLSFQASNSPDCQFHLEHIHGLMGLGPGFLCWKVLASWPVISSSTYSKLVHPLRQTRTLHIHFTIIPPHLPPINMRSFCSIYQLVTPYPASILLDTSKKSQCELLNR